MVAVIPRRTRYGSESSNVPDDRRPYFRVERPFRTVKTKFADKTLLAGTIPTGRPLQGGVTFLPLGVPSGGMPSLSESEREIRRLHEFFVEWYAGTVDRSTFDRMDEALEEEFRMVTPDGTLHTRADVLEMVRGSYGRNDPGEFEIDIRNVERRSGFTDHATVRYEEWQTTPDGTSGRISTALLRDEEDAPAGIVWLDLHETWLEED